MITDRSSAALRGVLGGNDTEDPDYFPLYDWYDLYNPLKDTSNLIWRIGNPLVCVLGIFGNFMIILIMLRLPASTYSVFFNILACSDQLVLMSNPLSDFAFREFQVPYFFTHGSWQCKVYKFVQYTTAVLSPWMLVTLTMLRAASVLWPLRVNAVWTKAKSRITAGIMTSVIVLIHSHFLYGFGVGWCGKICCYDVVSRTYRWFFENVWSWVDMTECSLLPFILLGVSNSVLLWTLVRSVRTGTRLPVQPAAQDSRERKASLLTVTLVATSVSFLLLATPITLYTITYPSSGWEDPIQYGQYEIYYAAVNILWYSNSAVNFYLYCLTGAKFRAEFKTIMFQFVGLFHETKHVCSQHGSERSLTAASRTGTASVKAVM